MMRILHIALASLVLGFFVVALSLLIKTATAHDDPGTNILSDVASSSAWSDITGWWDFHRTHTVLVGTSSLHGYASSTSGEMALNCASTPNGDTCNDSNYKVTNPGATGQLSGCAWNDTIGWISFWCGDGDCDGSDVEDASSTCAQSSYRVTIDGNGVFQGYAWNDVEGWIDFNSSTSTVVTTWRAGRLTGTLISPIIDSQRTDGVTLQSITWQGTQPAGTSVDFQVAVSNSTSGPWTYKGPDGDTNKFYGQGCPSVGVADPAVGPNKAICVDKNLTKNFRYVRYKVRLQSNLAQDQTPQINDIILNWAQ